MKREVCIEKKNTRLLFVDASRKKKNDVRKRRCEGKIDVGEKRKCDAVIIKDEIDIIHQLNRILVK